MSSIASNFVEKTLSQSHSQLFAKTFRGIDDEIIAKINKYRLRVSQVKEKLEELIKDCSNPEDHTIVIKELNKVVHYESQDKLDKLMNYLSYLSEIKHTIPDFFHTPFLNSVFTRNFSATIDTQKSLLQKSNETYDKLKKLIPSRNYLGIYIPNLDFKDIDLILCFIVLEEFLMLSNQDGLLKSENLIIESNSEETPQHISIFNPSFNTLVVYANEREQHLYLLFLTDVLELMGPDNAEFPFLSRVDLHEVSKKAKFPKTTIRITDERTGPELKKYDNLKTTVPDFTIDQVQKFVKILDDDNDFKINVENVLEVIKKNKIAWEDSVVTQMFDEIYRRRNVVMESQRRNPVDAYEIFHEVRYKYKKDQETQQWVTTARPFRDQWILIFKLVGIEIPKHTLPPLRPSSLQNNYEINPREAMKLKTKNNKENGIIIKNLKPEILKTQYKPEADILIQNTQNIMELYMEDREHAKPEDSNKNAFQTIINAKVKDLTQKTEFQTIEFNTQQYYREALRLSKNPDLYITEKVNPIFKYVPVKKDYVFQQYQQELESVKDTRSALQTDEVELDESVEPNLGSKRVTLFSFRDAAKSKSMKSIRQVPDANAAKILGSKTRAVLLSSSTKQRTHSPQNSKSKRPIFLTSFKIPDNETIRAQIAKLEPILDSYNPPKNHVFRNDISPEDKPQFISNWKKEISDVFKNKTSPKDQEEDDAAELKMFEEYMKQHGLKDIPQNSHLWTRYFKLAPRERGFVDHKYPEFLPKGQYVDGFVRAATFIREATETEVPFKLFHRPLRKTDKNLSFGEDVPTKI